MITALIVKTSRVRVKVVVAEQKTLRCKCTGKYTGRYSAEAFINGVMVAKTTLGHSTEENAARAVINKLEKGEHHD